MRVSKYAGNPRSSIEKMIASGDLEGLLKKAAELHGHFCPFLTLGVRAGYIGVKTLGIKTKGMEEFLAVIETNNCFSDGVQMVSGCSFGNNSLIYRDFGKTAVSFLKRDGKGIRILVKIEDGWIEKRYPVASDLFKRVVMEREGNEEDEEILMKEWSKISFDMLNYPDDELFLVRNVALAIPDYAPIFNSVRCILCGEMVMETRAIEKDSKTFCIQCSGKSFHQLDGSGISLHEA
ncbi:MAG: FmdE family protein [Spirochaetota bacterium]